MTNRYKPKKCRWCKKEFAPSRPLQKVCSYQCAIKDAESNRKAEKAKKFKAETRRRKEALKTTAQCLGDAQKEFNKFIRLRDHGKPCISCGRKSGCKINAGHFRSVGACPELRFVELNVHLQCEHCNQYKSGNIDRYRINLVKKIGLKKVEWLEGNHAPKRYRKEDAEAIKKKYRLKAKKLLTKINEVKK